MSEESNGVQSSKMSRIPVIDFEDKEAETAASKLKRKTMDQPFVPIGMAGFFAAVAYGAYAHKNRGQMSTSIYLMRLRVMAQSVAVGSITLGAAYTLLKPFFPKEEGQK